LNVDFDVIHFTEINKLKSYMLSDFDKVILCGVALKDFEYMNYLEKFEWLIDFSGDVLGICAGAQIIGKLFGCDFVAGQEIGLVDLKVLMEDSIFDEVDLSEVYCLHSQSILLNSRFDVLAKTSNFSQVFKLKDDNRRVYGVLFHPEVRNKKIIENFIGL